MKRYIKCSISELVFENCGDTNFLDGGCVVAKDGDRDGCYYVVTCDYVWDTPGDHHYLIQDCYVDINDDWIDVAAVERFADANKEVDPEMFAADCVRYYGGQEFGANVPHRGLSDYDVSLYTAEGVEEYMSQYNLPVNIYFAES